MIIVLCGVRGSGKDTIGDILVRDHGFQKEAFANPLKAMVKHAFPAFTDEDLYGTSKNRERPFKQYPRTDQVFAYPELPPDSTWVPLSRGKGWALISAVDLPRVSQHHWQLHPKGRESRTIYAKTDIGRKTVSLHQFLVGARAPGTEIDHVNGDGLDNRRENLRVCTKAENRRNERKRVPAKGSASSPFKGVIWDAKRGLWQGRISIAGRTTNLGRFSSEQDAAVAYDMAAEKAFGPFARLNRDIFLTPRRALQELGTGWGRRLYSDVWIDAAFARIEAEHKPNYEKWSKFLAGPDGALVSWEDYKKKAINVVITDGRFRNETRRSRELGGITIQLTRGLKESTDPHPSEAELRTMKPEEFDLVFNNALLTLEELPREVGYLLKRLKEKA